MKPHRATIIVTDGEQRSALAITRSLGQAGHRCIVLSSSGRSLAGASRYADQDILAVSAGAAPERFADHVAQLATRERAAIVIPVTEESALSLLRHRDSIPAAMPFPHLDVFRAVCDKAHVLGVALGVGIRIPEQQELRSPNDAAKVTVPLPLVLKPARSVYTLPDGTRRKVSVVWAHDEAALDRELHSFDAEAYPVLAQEVISGPGIGVFLFLHEGEVLARFAHMRMREKPPTGGVSVVRRSVPMDEDLFRRSVELMRALHWSGVAMVEFKQDAKTGEAVLMEVNGRFWGSLQLAIDAGVDFPSLVVDALLGRSVQPVSSYRSVVTRWEWGDVDHLIARLKGVPGEGGRMHAIGAWLRGFGPGFRSEVLRARDPAPFVRESRDWVCNVLRRD